MFLVCGKGNGVNLKNNDRFGGSMFLSLFIRFIYIYILYIYSLVTRCGHMLISAS